MPAGGTPPPQTRLQCPVAGADQRGRPRTARAVRGQTAPTGASAVAAVKTRWYSRPLDPIQRGGSRFALGPTPIPSSPHKPSASAAEERAWW